MRKFILAALLLPVTASGSGSVPRKTIKNKKLERLVSNLAIIPGKKCISKESASAIEVPEHWECRFEEIPLDSVTDDIGHNANLLVETSTSTTEQGPRRLLFITLKAASDQKSGEFHTFVSSLEGELIKALATYGKYNEKGEAVRGSGIDIPQDLDSKEVRARFKHELEFWLDGKYRKKAKKS